MSINSKVLWREGMFMRPQHFQQMDRHVEALVEERASPLRPWPWGVVSITLDQALLALGKVAISACRGALPDGTVIHFNDAESGPDVREIPPGTLNQTVYLALPVRRFGAPEVEVTSGATSATRYKTQSIEARNVTAPGGAEATIEVAAHHWVLLLENEPRDDYVCMGLLRVVEARDDGALILDEDYIRPVMDCRGDANLVKYLKEIVGLLHSRGEELAARVSMANMGGVSEISDFMMLQVVNRWEPVFSHLAHLPGLHPENFFRVALQLAGELAVFAADNKRPAEFPVYNHEDLAGTFRPVMEFLRRGLSVVLQQNAIALPLLKGKYGVWVSALNDRSVLSDHRLVLAVAADLPPEDVRSNYPTHVKIGPLENIRQLVNLQLPGIGLSPMPVAPRELPYHAGFTYFELDQSSNLWSNLQTSGGFAFHVSGNFPNLRMEFWAIRN